MGATFCAHLLLYVGLQDKEVVVVFYHWKDLYFHSWYKFIGIEMWFRNVNTAPFI